MSDVEYLGGWPKIMGEEPSSPNDIFGDVYDETDVPHDINISGAVNNFYRLIDVFIKFVDLGLYPPKWVLDDLRSKFAKHFETPDPELLASQLGVTGRGSGVKSPYEEYVWWRDRNEALEEMIILMGGFNISFTLSARAVIAKYEMNLSEKRLMAEFREHYGDQQHWLRRNRPESYDDPFMLDPENLPQTFLSSFPRHIRKQIEKKR